MCILNCKCYCAIIADSVISNFAYCMISFMPCVYLIKTLNFMAPFYGWGSTASRLQPLRGGSLLFTIQFPGISVAHFIDIGRMKG